jgi:hypothetical protein
MFSKLTISLAMVLSCTLASNAMAQTKKADQKKTANAKAIEAKKAEEARLNAAAANKRAEDQKTLEAKRTEEAKAAAAKAEASPTSSGVLGYIKSHFSAAYHGEFYFTRKDISSENKDDHGLQDFKQLHNPTIIYRPLKNWKLLVTSEFKYNDNGPAGTYINRHFRDLILLTRENILTEKENGLKMDIGIGRRIFDRNHGLASSYGNNRLNTTLSKGFFEEKLTTSILIQYLNNDPAIVKPITYKHSLELIPSFTWQITDKISYFFNDDFIFNTSWNKNNYNDTDFSHEMNVGVITYKFDDKNSTYFQFKYLRFSNPAAGQPNVGPFQKVRNTDDWFEYYIGHAYSFTPKITVTGEVGSKIFGASDGRDFFAKEVAYPEFALYLDMAI